MKYREVIHYKYELMEAFTIKVDLPDTPQRSIDEFVFVRDGDLILSKYYAWDGSTIPMKGLFGIIGWNSDKFCKIASLVHDALYQLMKAELLDRKYKDYADRFYQFLCKEGGMPDWQANLRYWALKNFGSLKYQDMTPEIFEV